MVEYSVKRPLKRPPIHPGEILRELVKAFNDNRLRIKPKKVDNPDQLEMYEK